MKSTNQGTSEGWPSDWLRATLGLCTLRSLEAGPSYGYAIISSLKDSGLGTVKGGTLYPLLTRYEEAGLVSTEWKAGDGGPGRKFFALTKTGRSELHRLRAEWSAFTTISNSFLAADTVGKEVSS